MMDCGKKDIVSLRYHGGLLLLAALGLFWNLARSEAEEPEKSFVGDRMVMLSKTCRPSTCEIACQNECEAIVGEPCGVLFDECQRCLKTHPLSPEEAKVEGIVFGGMLETCPWCLNKYPPKSRCTANTEVQSAVGAPEPEGVPCYITCR